MFVKTVRETEEDAHHGRRLDGVCHVSGPRRKGLWFCVYAVIDASGDPAKWHLGRRLHVLSSLALCPLAQMR